MSAPCTSRLLLAAPACLLLTVGCADETTGAGDSPSTAVSEAGPGATAGASTAARTPADVGWFRDATAAAGLPTERPMTDAEPRAIVEVKGGGLALFDFEGDGDLDMYDPGQGSFEAPAASALHVNLSTEEGRLAFKPGTLMPGDYPAWPMGLAVGDLDGDGYQDLYQTAHGPNAALWSTSTNVVRALGPRNTPTGLEHDGFGMAAALGDLDNDGDLDVYLVNYLELDLDDLPPDIEFLGEPIFAGPMGLTPEADAVFENLGDGTFKDKTFRSGIGVAPPSYGLGVTMLDLDADGDLDVFVGNDSMRNFVYENEGGFRFAERGMELGLAANGDGREQATMGISATDLNDDGVADLYTTNFASDTNTLWTSSAGRPWRDRTAPMGLTATGRGQVGWASLFGDFDLDGDEDLVAVNGHVYPDRLALKLGSANEQRPLAWARDGRRFAAAQEDAAWTAEVFCGRGGARADLDLDGDLDLVVGAWRGPLRLFEGLAADAGDAQLRVRLQREGVADRQGLGARVELVEPAAGEDEERVTTRWVQPTMGFQSSGTAAVFLPSPAAAATLRVTWPDGVTTEHPVAAGATQVTAPRVD